MTRDVTGIHTTGPLVIGLTGPIASGKSTVAEMFRERGAEIIDADHVYHVLIKPHSPLLKSIVDRFGGAVLTEGGDLNRPALASMVFGNPAALADLDRITHPAVVAAVRRRIAQSTAPYVVVEAVKLVQSGLASDVNSLWLITADEDTRIRRLMLRNGLSREEASKRVLVAVDTLPGEVAPDVIIDTSGSLASTRDAVDAAWSTLLESHARDDRAKA
jgi:dephospho-CoA kinase